MKAPLKIGFASPEAHSFAPSECASVSDPCELLLCLTRDLPSTVTNS